MDLFKKCGEYTTAKEAQAAGIYPYFHKLESRQDIVVEMEGIREIMIGSNNYLGLTSDPRVILASIEATAKYGTGCSGSRFLNGNTAGHVALEKELAEFLQKFCKLFFECNVTSGVTVQKSRSRATCTIFCSGFNRCQNNAWVTCQTKVVVRTDHNFTYTFHFNNYVLT